MKVEINKGYQVSFSIKTCLIFFETGSLHEPGVIVLYC